MEKSWEDVISSIKGFINSISIITKTHRCNITIQARQLDVQISWIGDDALEADLLLINLGRSEMGGDKEYQKNIVPMIDESLNEIVKSIDDKVQLKFESDANKRLRSTIFVMGRSILQMSHMTSGTLRIYKCGIDQFSWRKFPGMYKGRERDDLTKMYVQGVQLLKWKCVKGLEKTLLAKKMQRFALIDRLDQDAVHSVLSHGTKFTLDDINTEVKHLSTWNEDSIKAPLLAFMSHLANIFSGYVYNLPAEKEFECPNQRRFMAEVEISGIFGRSAFANRSICWRKTDSSLYEGTERCTEFKLCPEQDASTRWCNVSFQDKKVIVEWFSPTPLGNYGYKGLKQGQDIVNRCIFRVLELGETIIEDRITNKDAMNAWRLSLADKMLEYQDISRGGEDTAYAITRSPHVAMGIMPDDMSSICYMYWDRGTGTATFSPDKRTGTVGSEVDGLCYCCATCSRPILLAEPELNL